MGGPREGGHGVRDKTLVIECEALSSVWDRGVTLINQI